MGTSSEFCNLVRGRSFDRGSSSSGIARSRSKVKRKFCNYCHKKGHVIEECYKLKNKEKENAATKGKHVPGSPGILYGLKPLLLDGQTVTDDKASRLWHLQLGHMSFHGMSELSRRGLLGGDKVVELEFCEECVYGKQKRGRFMSGKHTTKGPLDYIHSDLRGTARVTSIGGASYMLTIIDDFSRKVWSFFLKHKGDIFSIFRYWKVIIEKQSGRERIDKGLEFCSEDFNAYCRKEGITRHRMVVHTSQQNGVAERMNRTILEKAEAASTTCFLINRLPSRAIEKKTPIELWSDVLEKKRIFAKDNYETNYGN
ncbi:hypothetical protein OSB04_011987 [Centaurea solstitialis]|uniref:Integrase catalytic domain-containing protein n=1 Tax=Centaurea solstitialis TaxID=347529 RepID=A0AA38TI32_9ASTR|nr:hypothetical protein OSB04_011987 [Centaurea solstitialis]